MRTTAILSVILFVIGAALGAFVTAAWKDSKCQETVAEAIATEQTARSAVAADLATSRLAMKMADFRLRLGTLAIEAGRLNYGTAKDQSVQYFAELSEFAEEAKGSPHEESVALILASRDQIVSDLSVGSPTAAEALELLYLDLSAR